MLCWQVRKGGNSKEKGKRILIYIGVILVPQQFPQLDHMATCEWWNCGPTWNHYFFSTTYTLPHRQSCGQSCENCFGSRLTLYIGFGFQVMLRYFYKTFTIILQ